MSELNLPTLPKNYRWKISPVYQDSYSSVSVKLEKRTFLLGWIYVRSQVASDFATTNSLKTEIESTAANIWDIEFGDSAANKYSGVYYGDNQHRPK